MKTALRLLLVLLIPSALQADPGFLRVQTILDWERVLQLAEEKQKLIYVFYTSDDCEPCEFMERSSFDYDEVEDYYDENFINVRIEEGSSFARVFADGFTIREVPSSIWLTGSEFVWKMEVGSLDNAELLTSARRVAKLTREFRSTVPYALSGGDTLNVDRWFELLFISAINNQTYEEELVESFRTSLNLDSLRSEKYWPYIMTYVSDLTSPLYQYIAEDWKLTLGEDFPWENYYNTLYEFNLNLAIQREDSVLVETIQYQLLPTLETDSTQPDNELAMQKLMLWQDYYIGLGSLDRYLEVTDVLMDEVEPNPIQMGQIIKNLTSTSRSQYALEKGISWIDKVMDRESDAQLNIMKADLLIVLGKSTDAIRVLNDADKLNPNEEEKELINFLKFVAERTY